MVSFMVRCPDRHTNVMTNTAVLGGGGFSEEVDNSLVDDYILTLTGSSRPRVCFLPTASGDSKAYIDKFYAAFPPIRAKVTHLSVFALSEITWSHRSFVPLNGLDVLAFKACVLRFRAFLARTKAARRIDR